MTKGTYTKGNDVLRGVQKLTLAALTALALTAGAVAAAPAAELAGDPSQWGIQGAYKKGSFDITEADGSVALTRKVNEYEGQHRITEAEDSAELTRKVNEYEGQHRVG